MRVHMTALRGNTTDTEEDSKSAWSSDSDFVGMQPHRPLPDYSKTFKATQYLPSTTPSSIWPIRIAQDLLDAGHWARNRADASRDLPAETKQWLCQERLDKAKTFSEWQDAAHQLDLLEGNYFWRIEDESEYLDSDLIRKRLTEIKTANDASDWEQMLSHMREFLKRDLGGMCDPRLYEHCYNGTKLVVDQYVDVVKYTIERLVGHCETVPKDCYKYLEAIKSARDSYGTSALMLSGGGTLGMCHIGVVKALLQANLLPKIICGSSAGSIVGAVLCTNRREELIVKLRDLCNGDLKVFQSDDEPQGVVAVLANLLRGGPAFRVENLCRVMKDLLGNVTFREAYNQTGMVLNIHVSSKDRHNLPRLLNYITSPSVVIWTAVATSCSLPGVFTPPGLQAKDPESSEIKPWGDKDFDYIDGSIEGDLPSQVLERLFNVNNFIASQVNPHVTPLIKPRAQHKLATFVHSVSGLGHASAVKFLAGLVDMGIDYFPVRMAFSVLTQKYDGDITLLPAETFAEAVGPLAVFTNPTPEFMLEASRVGERRTWPAISRIRNMVDIELALDAAIAQVQTQIIANRTGSPLGYRRAISSTRSERGLHRTRNLSTSFIPSARRGRGRGRGSFHQARQSMFEPLVTTSAISPSMSSLFPSEPHQISSSDEAYASGGSSPTASHENDDMSDEKYDSGTATAQRTDEEDACIQAFLSQPASPSISFKRSMLWGTDNSTAGHTPPPEVNNSGVQRFLNGLQMTTISPRSLNAKLEQTRKRDNC